MDIGVSMNGSSENYHPLSCRAMQVAGSPELYPVLVDIEGCILMLLACLSHENTDIAADTLELFMELTGGGEQRTVFSS